MSYLQQRPQNQNIRESQGQRKKEVLLHLGNNNPSESTGEVTVQIKTPSSRISGYVEIFYDSKGEPIEEYNSTWVINAYAATVSTEPMLLHQVDPIAGANIAVPRSYEWNSGVKVLRVEADLGYPTHTGAGITGQWYARGYWEANTPISDEELTDIFNECRIEKIK